MFTHRPHVCPDVPREFRTNSHGYAPSSTQAGGHTLLGMMCCGDEARMRGREVESSIKRSGGRGTVAPTCDLAPRPHHETVGTQLAGVDTLRPDKTESQRLPLTAV